MQFATQNLTKKTGNYIPGICKMFLIPIKLLPETETNYLGIYPWPLALPYSSFEANDILEIDLVKESYSCRETQKNIKPGNFHEIKIAIESNNLDEDQRRTLITLSHLPIQVLAIFNNHKNKLFGDRERGLDLVFQTDDDNGGSKTAKVSISITGETVLPAPYTSFTI